MTGTGTDLKQRSRIFPPGTGWRVRETLGKLGLLEFLLPRRFHIFGCGAGKTGTHSMCNIFRNYRSGHEADRDRSLALAIAYFEGEIGEREMQGRLRVRDHRVWLEMDAFFLSGRLAASLKKTFPAAKFILTVRDVYSWVDSVIDHQLNYYESDIAKKYMRVAWGLDRFSFTRFDEPLRERGVYPLAAYLTQFSQHNLRVIDSVPENRLLIVRTHEIGNRLADIAGFVGVPVEALDNSSVKSFVTPTKHRVLSKLDQNYLQDEVEKFCGELMRRFFLDMSPHAKV